MSCLRSRCWFVCCLILAVGWGATTIVLNSYLRRAAHLAHEWREEAGREELAALTAERQSEECRAEVAGLIEEHERAALRIAELLAERDLLLARLASCEKPPCPPPPPPKPPAPEKPPAITPKPIPPIQCHPCPAGRRCRKGICR